MSQAYELAAKAGRHELTVTRIIDAPRPLVFRAWTQPEHAGQWWGPQGFAILSCQMDVRPGGKFHGSMRSPAGTIHTKFGVYREVTPPDRLVFTFAWEEPDGGSSPETLVTVSLEDLGERTRLTLHQAFFADPAVRDEHTVGWTSAVERLAEYIAADKMS